MHALIEIMEEPLTLGTVYGGAILLVMLYAMALLTRRVRVLQSNLEGLQSEVKLLGEAMQDMARRRAPQAEESIDSVLGAAPPVEESATEGAAAGGSVPAKARG